MFQATNRYIDLLPVVKRLASEFGLEAVVVSDHPNYTTGAEYWLSSTDQILEMMRKHARDLEHFLADREASFLELP